MTDWKLSWIRGGKVSEIAWINEEIIAWCSGIHVVFFNIVNCTQTLFSSPSFDGACTIAGNPKVSIFAFSERCESPRILVYTYPKLTLITECVKSSEHGYLAVAFASSHFLVSLGSYPTYSLTVWNWKTGEKLFSTQTLIHDFQGQIIRISADRKQKFIAQLGRDSGKLLVWEIMSTTTIMMSQQEILLPGEASAVYVDWVVKNEIPQLVIVDKHGHVYLTNKDGSEIKRIVFSQHCGVCLEYELPIVCWFEEGILLKTTFCQLRYYKKNEQDVWKKQAYLKSDLKPYILSIHPFNNNKLFYLTIEGYLMEMNLASGADALEAEEKFNYGGIYNFVDLVYPLGQHLVVIDYSLVLSIRDVMDGKEISKLSMEMEGQVSNLVTHPDYPIAAIITTSGELHLIDVIPENLSPLLKIRLQHGKLDLLKFSHSGKHLIVARKLSHTCYCITSDKNPFSNIHRLETEINIIDFCLIEVDGIFNLCLLALSSSKVLIGNYIVVYKLLRGNFKESHISYLPSAYKQITYGSSPTIFIATPFLSRQIHYLSYEKESGVKLIKAEATKHQFKNLNLHTNRYCSTICGFDGLITILTAEQPSGAPDLFLHHRKDFGTSKAYCIPSKGLIVALGRNGSIICKSKEAYKKSRYLIADIFRKLSRKCTTIPEAEGKTWVEWMEEEQLRKEEEEYRSKRLKIKKDFDVIKNKIKAMLDDNENNSDIEISDFDLARIMREEKIKEAEEERKDLQLKLEFECSSMDTVSDWIKSTFGISILDKSLITLFNGTSVTNCSTAEDRQEDQITFSLDLYKMMEKNRISVSSQKSGHFLLVRNKYNPSCQDEKSVIESLIINDDEEYEDEEDEREEQQQASGTTTYKFVEPFSRYSQYLDYSFSKFISMAKININDAQQLRDYFNNMFDEAYLLKESTMQLIIENNAKVRHIDSELQSMFNQSVPEILPDPQWHWSEQPASLIEVLDHEVTAKAFISSSQELFNETKEQEKLLSVLPDDFREKALMEMMDGVLEISWEDVIKTDIMKPNCMLMKEPQEYTADDLLEIKQYENDVQALMQDREKYKLMLEDDYQQIMKLLKEEIEKFNTCLHDLLIKKNAVESAIQQLNLLRARMYIRFVYKLKLMKKMQEIKERIDEKEKIIEIINQQNYQLQNLLPDLKNKRENMNTKEKLVLKNFRDEFKSVGKKIQEILKNEFTKRPKVSIKGFTIEELIELGKCVIGCGIIEYLVNSPLEYLKILNSSDTQPSELPDSITPHYWNRLVQLRRSKIEIELNLKANMNEINEVELSMNENKMKIRQCKEDIGNLEVQLKEIEKNKIEFHADIEIQLILKMKQVEVNLNGERGETNNTILVAKEDVEKINDKIVAGGIEKLKALKKEINFHRGVMLKEWEHQYLRMKIEDYEHRLNEVKNFFVTHDIRKFLTEELSGKKVKSGQEIEKMIELRKNNLKKLHKSSLKMLKDIERKIQVKKNENEELDKTITRINVKRWEMELKRDLEGENRLKEIFKKKLKLVMQRSKLVRDIQDEYRDVLALKDEYNAMMMKKYPFNYL